LTSQRDRTVPARSPSTRNQAAPLKRDSVDYFLFTAAWLASITTPRRWSCCCRSACRRVSPSAIRCARRTASRTPTSTSCRGQRLRLARGLLPRPRLGRVQPSPRAESAARPDDLVLRRRRPVVDESTVTICGEQTGR
jgi:hypothetical protein